MSSKTAETCKFCKKVVVIDPVKEDVDGVYMIANCDSCNAMTCRECLTTDIEGQCKGCYTPDNTTDDELTDYEEVYNGRKSRHPSMDSNDWEAYDLYVSNTQMEWDNEGDEFIGGWQESKRWL